MCLRDYLLFTLNIDWTLEEEAEESEEEKKTKRKHINKKVDLSTFPVNTKIWI